MRALTDSLLDEFMIDFLPLVEMMEAISKKWKPFLDQYDQDLTPEQEAKYQHIIDRFNKVMDEMS